MRDELPDGNERRLDHGVLGESFAEWVNASASEGLNELYTRMLGMLGGDAVVKGVHGLIQGDYISREDRDGATYFTVTEKFVTFMERYASVA